ncbi:ABC transporter permease [Acidiferrimicrobium sp. IK]|uniref:ABC transporter permease n=1 Tax=Acidiferrimicrobium sp. IK TaxID=2871700 RepID=UPI0021CB02E5|nr:ABC transporter permease [Acidiferrimicrobium sp. IK]MCU4185588.1 ABC transporter permease [Acidiferrimicrobium sp. IK]
MTTVAEYRGSRELLVNLTLRELRSKYKRSFLGWTWSLVNPLVNTLVYTVVFLDFFHAHAVKGSPSGLTIYSLYLLCAMLPFNYVQNTVMGSIGSLIGNGNLIKKTYFPRALLPAATTLSNLVSHGIEMALLIVILLAFGQWRVLPFLPIVVLLMVVNAIFALGMALMFSVLNVYFRDIEHFMGIFFLLWFYGTPIIYPLTQIGHHPAIMTILKINPMTDMAAAFRAVMYSGTWPPLLSTAYFVASAFVMFGIGYAVFSRMEGHLAEEL